MLNTVKLTRLWKFSFIIALLAPLMILSAPDAAAQSLNDLRASGQIGEGFDGYVHARDASVASNVAAINAKRKAIYVERAQQQGISIDQVGKVYAEQIFGKLPAGTWILSAGGSWSQK